MILQEKILTERFCLKVLSPDLVTQKYLSWIHEDMAQKYISDKKSFLSLDSLKKYVSEREENDNAVFFGIFTLDEVHIGNIKYEPINFTESYAIMGILIGDINYRGKNVAGEVILATSAYLRDKFQIKLIVLGVDKQNLSAIRSYQKIGFYEKEDQHFITTGNGVCMLLDVNEIETTYSVCSI